MIDSNTPLETGDRVTYDAAAFTGTVIDSFCEDGRHVVRIRFDNGTFLEAYADDRHLDAVPMSVADDNRGAERRARRALAALAR